MTLFSAKSLRRVFPLLVLRFSSTSRWRKVRGGHVGPSRLREGGGASLVKGSQELGSAGELFFYS